MIFPRTLKVAIVVAVFCSTRSHEIPGCAFDDTVDLTHAHMFPNGSYLYRDSILILPDQVGIYDYEMSVNDVRLPRELHPRGCLCKERVCIKFCCHPTNELITNGTTVCSKLHEDLKYDPYINMIYKNLSSVRRNAIEDFIVLEGTPCENAYPLMPDVYSNDRWDIYENGELLRYHDNAIVKKTDYCLMPVRDSRDEWKLTAFNCPIPNKAADYNKVFNILNCIAIAFILTAAFVYMLLPELQGLRGSCLLNYVLSLAVGNIILTIVSMYEEPLPRFMCTSMGKC